MATIEEKAILVQYQSPGATFVQLGDQILNV